MSLQNDDADMSVLEWSKLPLDILENVGGWQLHEFE